MKEDSLFKQLTAHVPQAPGDLYGRILRPGDIIACSGRTPWSPWCHVAIVVPMRNSWLDYFEYSGRVYQEELLIFEGRSRQMEGVPCRVTGQPTCGLQAHSVCTFQEAWKEYRVYRLARNTAWWLTMQEQQGLAYTVLGWVDSSVWRNNRIPPGDIVSMAIKSGIYDKPTRIK